MILFNNYQQNIMNLLFDRQKNVLIFDAYGNNYIKIPNDDIKFKKIMGRYLIDEDNNLYYVSKEYHNFIKLCGNHDRYFFMNTNGPLYSLDIIGNIYFWIREISFIYNKFIERIVTQDVKYIMYVSSNNFFYLMKNGELYYQTKKHVYLVKKNIKKISDLSDKYLLLTNNDTLYKCLIEAGPNFIFEKIIEHEKIQNIIINYIHTFDGTVYIYKNHTCHKKFSEISKIFILDDKDIYQICFLNNNDEILISKKKNITRCAINKLLLNDVSYIKEHYKMYVPELKNAYNI